MGRWDALKADNETKGNGTKGNVSNRQWHHHPPLTLSADPKVTSGSSKWRFSKSAEGSVLGETEKAVTERSRLSENIQTQYQRLILCCAKETENSFEQTQKIGELSILISKDRVGLENSSLNLSEDVVDGVFLPFLEYFLNSLVEGNVDLGATQNTQIALQVMCALERLLEPGIGQNKSSPRVSELLAPLVVEVSDSGKEMQKPNRIRLRLLTILQSLLQDSSRYTSLQKGVVSCLLQALKAARTIEGTTKHAMGSQLDVEPLLLYRFFIKTTEESTILTGVSMELLTVLVQRHPETSSQLMTYLLVQHQFNPSQKHFSRRVDGKVTATPFKDSLCICCDSSRKSYDSVAYLCVLHGSRRSSEKSRSIAANLMLQVLDHLPPSIIIQWLTGRSSFGDRIKTGIKSLMDSCRCSLLCGKTNNRDPSMALLAGTILRRIPFSNIHTTNSEVFLQTARCLAAALLEHFLALPVSQHRGDAIRTGVVLPLPQQSAADALILAIGGSETPQGLFLEMSLPLKQFLNTSQGHMFLSKLLDQRCSYENGGHVLRAIVRTNPRPFLSKKELWSMFVELVFGGSAPEPRGGGEMQTLVALLEGRRDFADTDKYDDLEFFVTPTRVVNEILPRLQSRLAPRTVAGDKIAALSAYGSLVPGDWDALVARSTERDHWDALLSVCRDSGCNSKVKRVAFKSLGDVATNFFSCASACLPNSLNGNKLLCNSVYRVIREELQQERASTSASMALYAFGNLARVLNQLGTELLDPCSLEGFAEILLGVCNPETEEQSFDPKMQTNAIRALGHLICLLCSSGGGEDANRCAILSQVLDTLASSVRRTILLARRETSGNLSWKARSAVKKIGWGSCHALGMVLPLVYGSDKLDERSHESSRQCLLTLIDCVLNLNRLHEKVGLVSISALCSVDLSCSRLTRSFSHDKQIALGPVIVQCLEFISGADDDGAGGDTLVLSPKMMSQVDSLFLHLLSCCSVSDAEHVLSSPSGDRDGKLRLLHNWLLNQKQRKGTSEELVVTSVQRAYDTFALAMQKRPDLLSAVDIRLEQQFVSEARPAVSMMEDGQEEEEL